MFFSCTKLDSYPQKEINEPISIRLKSNIVSISSIQTLDAFVFEPSGKLDCYQRFNDPSSLYEIASRSGDKQILLIANSKHDIYDWTSIRSLSTMADILADLEEESYAFPVMTSLIDISSGGEASTDLFPLRSEIMINSLRCDFSKKSYHHEKLTDIRFYLTNINATSSLVPTERPQHSRIINPGMLDLGVLEHFTEKDLVIQSAQEDVGAEKVLIQKSLFCYANQPEEESIGSPLTKLIIEGKIGGDTYYYPIRINPKGGGIARGCKYIFDIVITQAGVTDPDAELVEEDIQIKCDIERWKEKDGYNVSF